MKVTKFRCEKCGGNLYQEEGEEGLTCMQCGKWHNVKITTFFTREKLAPHELLYLKIIGAKKVGRPRKREQ